MTPTEAATILRQFNEWRRGGDIEQPGPLAVGEAIDAAIEIIECSESDLATAEQDSRQKQARIERFEKALGEIAWSNDSKRQSDRADAALEELK